MSLASTPAVILHAMSTNPYAPPGESPSDLWLERSNLVGAVLGGVAYGSYSRLRPRLSLAGTNATLVGVHVAVFAECVYRIAPMRGGLARHRRNGRLQSWFLLGYVFLLFLMGTVNLACNTKMAQLMFIDNRAFPGGPNAWFFANYNNTNNTAGNASYIIANFLADGLLVR